MRPDVLVLLHQDLVIRRSSSSQKYASMRSKEKFRDSVTR